MESWLPGTGLRYESVLTTRPLEATEIAQRAVRESRPVVVAVGGDGTLNEVVNGFFHNGAPIPTSTRLAMVPLGTGGDFRRTLRIPLEPKAAIQVLSDGLVRRLDAGCVTYQNGDGSTGVRHFINIADAGLGGDVVKQMGNGTKRFGSAAYTLGGLRALIG
ncbi:MAG TPA: diacylglycerol kinase family protein, partial [Thermoanaerobaculia bacterium]|nr:diacylglycerol kinase family protein [Thermoanaerobaculia bacterium]